MDKKPPKTDYSFMGFVLGGTLFALMFSDVVSSRNAEDVLIRLVDYVTFGNSLIDIFKIPVWIANFIGAIICSFAAVFGSQVGGDMLSDGLRMSGRLKGAIVGSLVVPLICIIPYATIILS